MSKERGFDLQWSPLCFVTVNRCLPGKLVHYNFRVQSAKFFFRCKDDLCMINLKYYGSQCNRLYRAIQALSCNF